MISTDKRINIARSNQHYKLKRRKKHHGSSTNPLLLPARTALLNQQVTIFSCFGVSSSRTGTAPSRRMTWTPPWRWRRACPPPWRTHRHRQGPRPHPAKLQPHGNRDVHVEQHRLEPLRRGHLPALALREPYSGALGPRHEHRHVPRRLVEGRPRAVRQAHALVQHGDAAPGAVVVHADLAVGAVVGADGRDEPRRDRAGGRGVADAGEARHGEGHDRVRRLPRLEREVHGPDGGGEEEARERSATAR
ncbi:protein YLS9 [Hordeum vulgare]|nr:protein YLS9 [Hordeum vulgare]